MTRENNDVANTAITGYQEILGSTNFYENVNQEIWADTLNVYRIVCGKLVIRPSADVSWELAMYTSFIPSIASLINGKNTGTRKLFSQRDLELVINAADELTKLLPPRKRGKQSFLISFTSKRETPLQKEMLKLLASLEDLPEQLKVRVIEMLAGYVSR